MLIRDLVLMKLDAVGFGAEAASERARRHGRRVALARSVALDPMLILYDEPFAGLDPISTASSALHPSGSTMRWVPVRSW